MKVFLVEDDLHAAKRLSSVLEEVDSTISIAGVCRSVKEAAQWLESHEAPDLIFLDIQLSDGISFELFHLVTITCPIIFLTAFDQYALEAFKVNSIDYILKPFAAEDLQKALSKYKTFYPSQRQAIEEEVMQELKKAFVPSYKSRFFAKINHTVYSIPTEEILYFCFEDNATVLVNNENRSFVINYSLDALESTMDPALFFRINRQCLIKIDSIKKMNLSSKSRMEVVLKNNKKELVSRSKTKDFRDWLDI
ncbi:MAG TPA: LytTR family DNA-binding domain-containing protein [Flavobacteriaceae bacterium]|nr:response regulator transcription factor [Flavobacteriaceae bacterium]MCB9212828.1 response regulator transcription factor [Alteromonas sp.]HPF12279.1 LytTR family DNA-binding domain-containing protein [Flavobacteriaceae bacterium]HQU21273.1 LytTR family DNA-binding domain-containing protein [Flavobacteriaceae bacterium]HQU66058.1 LytTR family DNA-binding domain-containing protein [Flavobacteriaceae bacterium]